MLVFGGDPKRDTSQEINFEWKPFALWCSVSNSFFRWEKGENFWTSEPKFWYEIKLQKSVKFTRDLNNPNPEKSILIIDRESDIDARDEVF